MRRGRKTAALGNPTSELGRRKEKITMKRFLIPATLLLIILLTAWGCGNSDNILAPESNTGNDVTLSSNYETDILAQTKNVGNDVDSLAAPKKDKSDDTTDTTTSDTEDATKGKGGKVTKKVGPSEYYYRR